jgi:AhpD family alkylhydroperoxidase
MSEHPLEATARQEWADIQRLAPVASAAVLGLERAANVGPLDPALVELVKLRVSQINGCAFCVQMHVQAARRAGVSEDQLQLLCVWHEASLFSPRERTALSWAEALTYCAHDPGAADAKYDTAQAEFGDVALAQLSIAIATINFWNRLAVGYRFTPASVAAPPGSRPKQ